jgi:hypothetical protein
MITLTVIKEQFPICKISLNPVNSGQFVFSSQICDVSVEVSSDHLFEELLCYLLFARDRRNFPLVMMEGTRFDFVSTTYNDLVFVLNTLPSGYRHEIEGQIEIVDDFLPEWVLH